MNEEYYKRLYAIAMMIEDALYRAGKTVTIVFERLEDKKQYDTNIERWGSYTVCPDAPNGYSQPHTDVSIVVGDVPRTGNGSDWLFISNNSVWVR